jgi:hypothetical protein
VFLRLALLLNAESALRSVHGFPAAEVGHALRSFAGLPPNPRPPRWIGQSKDWIWPRRCNLAAARGREGPASFDRVLARAARRIGAPRVREP